MIVGQITWSTHKITIQKIIAHIGIIGNEIANQVVNVGTTLAKPNITPQIHVAHTTYVGTRVGTIRNLQAYINKDRQQTKVRLAQ